jgi:uncharacterized lipoprotein YbaY
VVISGSSDLGNKTIAENGLVKYSVVATGQAPFSYQWRFNGQNISGATNSTLALASMQNSNAVILMMFLLAWDHS